VMKSIADSTSGLAKGEERWPPLTRFGSPNAARRPPRTRRFRRLRAPCRPPGNRDSRSKSRG
jgi:hypothetical protein